MGTRFAITSGLAALLVLSSATPALAAGGELELSADGTTFSATAPGPLFDSLDRLVPRDTRESSIWVRNTAATDANLRITITGSTWTDTAFAEALSVRASTPGVAGVAYTVASTAQCRVLLYGVLIEAGESVELTVTLTVGDLSGSTGQTADLRVDLGVALFEAPAGVSSGCEGATPVPLVAPRGGSKQPQPAPSVTPAAAATESTGIQVVTSPRFIELLTNTIAGFNLSILSWAAFAVIAGAVLYIVMGAVRSRRGLADTDEELTLTELALTDLAPIEKDTP
jgi:hypothetical protein